MQAIEMGIVKDRLSKSVYGVGILGNTVTKVNGKPTKVYEVWGSMLQRCYSDVYQKKQKSYIGCTVSDNFKNFEFFSEWFCKQIGSDKEDWDLDKDVLFKGNKVYSEETCVLLPRSLNIVLVKRVVSIGCSPIGVTNLSGCSKYIARLKVNGKKKHLGTYDTAEEAFFVYKQAKEDYIKVLAVKWKDQIDPRAYEALMNYQVEITD